MANTQKAGFKHWSGGNGSIIGVASHAINGGLPLGGFDGKVVSCTHGDSGTFLGVLLERGVKNSINLRSVATLNSKTMIDMVCDPGVMPGDKLNWAGEKLIKATGIAQFIAQTKAIPDPFNAAQHLTTAVIEETQSSSGIVIAQQAKASAIDGSTLAAAQKQVAELRSQLEKQTKEIESMREDMENMKKVVK